MDPVQKKRWRSDHGEKRLQKVAEAKQRGEASLLFVIEDFVGVWYPRNPSPDPT